MSHRIENLQRITFYCLIGIVLITYAGCGTRLSSQRQIELAPNNIESIVVEPAGKDQTINVSAKSDGGPFRIHIHLVDDTDAVDQSLARGKVPEKAIAGAADVTETELTALIPANQEASIRLEATSTETANVALYISN